MRIKRIKRGLKFSKPGPEINDLDLKMIEDKFGINLPKEYREFLISRNGGQPDPDSLPIIENGKLSDVAVRQFFKIGVKGDYSFEENFQIFKISEERLPVSLVPIGEDVFGNLFCISVGIDDYGKIYFWDHEGEMRKSDELEDNVYPSNVYLISDSFGQILEKFYEIKIEEEQ